MSRIVGLLGVASPIPPAEAQAKMGSFLLPNEHIVQAFRHGRDLEVFTNFRLIAIDSQGLSGRKTSYTSYPYSKITSFSLTTASTIDIDAELVITVGAHVSHQVNFSRGCDVACIQRLIAGFVCGQPSTPAFSHPPPQQWSGPPQGHTPPYQVQPRESGGHQSGGHVHQHGSGHQHYSSSGGHFGGGNFK